ncbi:response regulator [Pseudomonas simiae]|uniref:response regulator n=1 Tax=Pseudomonas simiae TaxID=321846 RepID=UPI0020D1143D|nr:response regulator [Pseudomonas simiae]
MSSDPIPGDQAGDDRVAQPPSTVHWRELKVLLVDDHPAYCLLMGAMFERLGLAFEVCAHGQAALAFLDVTCVDLISATAKCR